MTVSLVCKINVAVFTCKCFKIKVDNLLDIMLLKCIKDELLFIPYMFRNY